MGTHQRGPLFSYRGHEHGHNFLSVLVEPPRKVDIEHRGIEFRNDAPQAGDAVFRLKLEQCHRETLHIRSSTKDSLQVFPVTPTQTDMAYGVAESRIGAEESCDTLRVFWSGNTEESI